MSAHYTPPYAGPPSSSPPVQPQQRPFDPVKSHLMETDRTQREQSVLSGMSIEDMEAAETLNSLHKVQSPKTSQAPPTHIQISSSYSDEQPEPLLSLVTSQYPLAGAVINGSLSAYRTTQAYIPGAQWTERNVGIPIAGTVARISGVEGGLRWALQPKRDARSPNKNPQTPELEKGLHDVMPVVRDRRSSEISFSETLPAYNATDRSPPYEQQALLGQERRPPPGWRQQLMISTSGLGIAMSDESLRSLRYCLKWLKWANRRLGFAVQSLRDLVEQWSDEHSGHADGPDGHSRPLTQQDVEGREAALAARISAVRAEVLQVLKQVVNVVSTYAGGALPENARNLVHRHLISLPQRFNMASAMSNNAVTSANGQQANDAASNANRVMVLAQEGLDMMTQVSRVVNDTLISAEAWCERLGRRKRSNTDATNSDPNMEPPRPSFGEKDPNESMTQPQNDSMILDEQKEDDGDVKMEM